MSSASKVAILNRNRGIDRALLADFERRTRVVRRLGGGTTKGEYRVDDAPGRIAQPAHYNGPPACALLGVRKEKSGPDTP